MPKTILAFLETSAAHALIPVVRELRRRRITIPLYLEGDHDPMSELGKLYPELNDACIVRSADDLPSLGNQKVVLIALSAESKLSKQLLRQCKSCGASVIAVQPDLDDSCVSMLRGPEGETLYPEVVVLPHAYNVGQLLRATNIPSEDVVIAWPAMDRLARRGVTRESCAADLRKQLTITDQSARLVVLAVANNQLLADSLLGTNAGLEDSSAILLVKMDIDPEEAEPRQLQTARHLGERFGDRIRWITGENVPNTDHLLIGADLVVGVVGADKASPYPAEAIYVETPVVIFGGEETPALTQLGAAPHAKNHLELGTHVQETLKNRLTRLLSTWKRYFCPNSSEARRVADHVQYRFLEA